MLTQSELKKILSYDQETGDFTWLVGAKMAGKIAGSAHNKGYLKISNNGKCYLAHRLAWLYVNGTMPLNEIDHINGARNDNRIANLRACVKQENLWNVKVRSDNLSSFKGVSWHKVSGKWRAQIVIYGNSKHLGIFSTAELASKAYEAKARELHGEFYRNTTK